MDILKYKPEGWQNQVTKLNFENIENYINSGEILQGLVKKCDNEFNLHVQLNEDIYGIIPRNEVEGINVDESGNVKIDLCTGKVHKFVQFKIKEVIDNDNIILSRSDVQKETLSWIKNELKEGEKIEGIVKGIKPYGVFVEIAGGVVGMLHIEDISVARIKSPSERFKIGQKVRVMVKCISRQTGQVLLSHKEILGTWEENIKKYRQGTNVKGIIRETEKNKNGIFVELEPNLVGLAEYAEGLNYGETVNVYIRKIDEDRKKVKLLIIN